MTLATPLDTGATLSVQIARTEDVCSLLPDSLHAFQVNLLANFTLGTHLVYHTFYLSGKLEEPLDRAVHAVD